MKLRVVVGLLLVLACWPLHAATYYVSPTGNDTYNGSVGTPWRTIQHAIDTMVAGDTTRIRGGTYAECLTTAGKANGSVSSQINVQWYGDGNVLVSCSGNSAALVHSRAYWNFTGLGLESPTATSTQPLRIVNASNSTFSYVTERNAPALTTAGRCVLLSNSPGIKFYNSIVTECPLSGIELQTSSSLTVRNSIIAGNARLSGYSGIVVNSGNTLDLDYSLLAGNSQGSGGNISGSYTNGGHNIFTAGPAFRSHTTGRALVSYAQDDGDFTHMTAALNALHTLGLHGTVVIPIEDGALANLSTIQSYVNNGDEVGSHSYSHTFFNKTLGLHIQYTGAAATATMSITGTTLSLSTSLGENHSIDLSIGGANQFFSNLITTITGYGTYTITKDAGIGTSDPFSSSLADVSSQDIKTASYTALLDETRLISNEVGQSVAWYNSHLTGQTVKSLVYPGGQTTPNTPAIINGLGVGLLGARVTTRLGSIGDLASTAIFTSNAQQATGLGGTVASPLDEATTRANTRYFAEFIKAFGGAFTIYEDSVSETPPQNLIWIFDELKKDPEISLYTLGGMYAAIRADHTSADGGLTWTKSYGDNHDYRLQGGSAAVDSGSNLGSTYQSGCDYVSAACSALVNQNNYAAWDMGPNIYSPASEVMGVPSVSTTDVTATVTWTTAHPSSSWVYLNWNNQNGMPARYVGQADSVLSHSVTVTGLQPYNANTIGQDGGPNGKYEYYVASQYTGGWGTYGGPNTNAHPDVITFQTQPLNTGLSLNWRVQTYGQKNVYAGHDLYMTPATQLLAGTGGTTGAMTVAEVRRVSDNTLMPTIGVVVLSSFKSYAGGFNPGGGYDGEVAAQIHGKYAFGYPADASLSSGPWAMGINDEAIRIRVPSNIAAGDYDANITLQAYTDWGQNTPVGSPVSFTWRFHVYSPESFTATPPSVFPSIPSLATWKSWMTSSSQGGLLYWCDEATNSNPAAGIDLGPFLGPPYALTGSFNYNYFLPFNYDGGGTYLQAGDYDYSTAGMPGYQSAAARAHWRHCAQSVLAPYDNWITRSKGMQLAEPSQFLMGTGMYYARTGDAAAASALAQTTDLAGAFRGLHGTGQTMYVRVFAYTWMSQIANEASGVHGPWQLAGRATDAAIGLLDQFQQVNCTDVQPTWNVHGIQLGLLMRSLISQYELNAEKGRTPDARIPIEIGKSLYYLRDHFYNADIHTVRYNLCDYPGASHNWNDANTTESYGTLMALIAPAAAWYWSKTGDDAMRQFGDDLFAAIWNDTGNLTYAPKEANQVYTWTPDLVRWRSGPNAKPTFLPSQNPSEGSWGDVAPPVIMHEYESSPGSGILLQDAAIPVPSVAGQTVSFAWDTIENASSEIYYTTSTPAACTMTPQAYQSSVAGCLAQYGGHYSSATAVRHHAPAVPGLLANTTYHYRLYSQDAAGNGVMGMDGTFTTGQSPTVANPGFSPGAGTYNSPQTVTLSTATGGATICYAINATPVTDGAGTCLSGNTYSTPITVAVSETLYAIATKSGYNDSALVSAQYTINGQQGLGSQLNNLKLQNVVVH